MNTIKISHTPDPTGLIDSIKAAMISASTGGSGIVFIRDENVSDGVLQARENMRQLSDALKESAIRSGKAFTNGTSYKFGTTDGQFWIDETAPRRKAKHHVNNVWVKPVNSVKPSKLIMAMIKGAAK